MSLYELLGDLYALRTRPQAYERKYGVTSQDFYELYRQGLPIEIACLVQQCNRFQPETASKPAGG